MSGSMHSEIEVQRRDKWQTLAMALTLVLSLALVGIIAIRTVSTLRFRASGNTADRPRTSFHSLLTKTWRNNLCARVSIVPCMAKPAVIAWTGQKRMWMKNRPLKKPSEAK